ncbi:MAG: VIT1/CCC1 transporter family protein [Candidatus Heimdallarchaeota archaeon]
MLDKEIEKALIRAQRNEITEYRIYSKLASGASTDHNREILNKIAEEEMKHYDQFKEWSKREIKPSKPIVFFYTLIARFFGLTFSVRLMELGEGRAQRNYAVIAPHIPDIEHIIEEEEEHEKLLIALLDEELLDYMGSVVLGLNDALVELTGALAGLTFALNDTRLIAIAGLVTGIAASMSMAASEYLSTKSEEVSSKSPIKAAMYTGAAYIVTVIFLVAPYMLFPNESPLLSLGIALINAIIIVFLFTFYISVAKDLPFRKRFLEIVGISLGIAAISFVIGFVVNSTFNIDI